MPYATLYFFVFFFLDMGIPKVFDPTDQLGWVSNTSRGEQTYALCHSYNSHMRIGSFTITLRMRPLDHGPSTWKVETVRYMLIHVQQTGPTQ